jgi:hypothetical protein
MVQYLSMQQSPLPGSSAFQDIVLQNQDSLLFQDARKKYNTALESDVELHEADADINVKVLEYNQRISKAKQLCSEIETQLNEVGKDRKIIRSEIAEVIQTTQLVQNKIDHKVD